MKMTITTAMIFIALISMAQPNTFPEIKNLPDRGRATKQGECVMPCYPVRNKDSFDSLNMPGVGKYIDNFDFEVLEKQRLAFQHACNFRGYLYYKDKATAFGLISAMMSPCILAFSNSINHHDKLGVAFYGVYSVVSVGSGVVCVVNIIKARKARDRKIKK